MVMNNKISFFEDNGKCIAKYKSDFLEIETNNVTELLEVINKYLKKENITSEEKKIVERLLIH